MRGEYTPARVKVVFMLDHPDDEISVSDLTVEQRAASAAGAEVAFLIRTPDTADGFTVIPAPRSASAWRSRHRTNQVMPHRCGSTVDRLISQRDRSHIAGWQGWAWRRLGE